MIQFENNNLRVDGMLIPVFASSEIARYLTCDIVEERITSIDGSKPLRFIVDIRSNLVIGVEARSIVSQYAFRGVLLSIIGMRSIRWDECKLAYVGGPEVTGPRTLTYQDTDLNLYHVALNNNAFSCT